MSNRSDNILQMLKEQISTIEFESSNVDVGTVFKVGDGIAFVRGLDQVLAGEMVRFDHDVFPMKMNSSHRNRKHGFPASVIFGQAFFHGNEGGRF